MITQGQREYCTSCEIWFGAYPDENDEVHCRRCQRLISSKVVQLDRTLYKCLNCGLRFGAAPPAGRMPACPICNNSEQKKGAAL